MIEIWVGFSCVGISIIHQDAPRFGREMPIKQSAAGTLRRGFVPCLSGASCTHFWAGEALGSAAILHKISYVMPFCFGRLHNSFYVKIAWGGFLVKIF
jgi:hypothetical protein